MVQDDFKIAGALATGELTPEMVALINARMFPVEFRIVPTDIGFAIGQGVMSALIAKTLKGYYDKNLIKRVVLSGGVVVNDIPETKKFIPLLQKFGIPLPLDGEIETAYMKRILWVSDIPESVISIEDGSTNTGNNIALSSLHLEKPGTTATIFSLPGPRPLMTWRKQFPIMLGADPETYNIANLCYVYPPGLTKDNWHLDPGAREFVVKEYWKILPQNPDNYMKQGFCLDTPMEAELELIKSLVPNAPKNSRLLAAQKLGLSRGPAAL